MQQSAAHLMKILKHQIIFALQYGSESTHQPDLESIKIAQSLCGQFLESLPEISVTLSMDAEAALEGDPAETILRAADTFDVDIIIMGTRGLGDMRSLILGSQSHKVVSAATCPVMLVR